MMGPERLFAFGDLLANRRCAWVPAPFRHYPGILAGNSIGMAMTNGYVCGRVVAALWRSSAVLGRGICVSAHSALARLAAVALRRAL